MEASIRHKPEVILVLSEYEALFLYTLVANVGGPQSGPRGIADKLYDELGKLDLNRDLFTAIPDGAVYFE